MAAPDKTNETLDLAEARNQDASASDSLDDQSLSGNAHAKKSRSPERDDVNANVDLVDKTQVEALTKLLNETDMSFRQKVVTKDSSSEFIHSHDVEIDDDSIPSPFRGILSPEVRTIETDPDSGLPPTPQDLEDVTVIKPEADNDSKRKSGKVVDRVLEIQKSQPKKYTPTEFIKKEEPVEQEVEEPKTVNCPKCGRKISEKTLSRHVQFCSPDVNN